uniref:Uncharacterized protein n=1 Tax=Pithovirus LCPAC201 TaxID=2506591 RepID=A0A481Z4X4_9VIRU|nr:MAG: hypothetical protein LCPAC201_02440 [Pithovirus LCPAC201]
MQTLYDISPTFVELANETFQAAGSWWFDQIRTDGIIRFGDSSYKEMEFKSNLLIASLGGPRKSKKELPKNARQIFIDTLTKTSREISKGYGTVPKFPTDVLSYSFSVDYGVTDESALASALKSIGIPLRGNPLPMKTDIGLQPGLVTKYPHIIIYSDKDKWLKIWGEIETKVVSWDGKELILDTKLRKNEQYFETKLVSPKELYDFLSQ